MVTAARIHLRLPFNDNGLTITVDNGKELALHQKIAETRETQVYFAHPDHAPGNKE